MVVADPDEALIEAIAEATRRHVLRPSDGRRKADADRASIQAETLREAARDLTLPICADDANTLDRRADRIEGKF
jgi:hypothetical protein